MITCKNCGTNYENTFGNNCPICNGRTDIEDQVVIEEDYNESDFESDPEQENDSNNKYVTFNRFHLIAFVALMCAIVSCIISSCLAYISKLKKQENEYRTAMENAYNCGLQALDNRKYDQALDELSKITPDSEHYSDASSAINEAKEGYIKDVLRRSEDYADKGNYNQAISLLDSAISKIGDSEGAMTAKRDEYYALKVDIIVSKAVEDAEYAYNNNQIANAIRTLFKAENEIGDNVMLDVLLTQYVGEYKDAVTKEVDNLMATEGYKAYEIGSTMLDEAMSLIGNDDELVAKKNELYEYKPVPIKELYTIENYFTGSVEKDQCMDRLGNSYPGQDVLIFDAWYGSKMIIRTSGKYSRFTATLAPGTYEDEYGFNTSKRSPKFYVIDGESNVIASYPVSALTEPFEIDVDISEVNNLTLAITDFNNPEADTCEIICISPYVYSK